MTLRNALHNARYLNLMMRHSDKVEIACRSSMANSFCGGLIQTSPYALQLFARHSKPIPLRVEQPEGGPDLFACSSENRRSVAIFVVNSRTRPADWSFDLDGFNSTIWTIKAETLCDTLNIHQPDAMNHWEAPDRIRIVSLPASPRDITLPPLSVTVIECAIK
jgi:alpha-L-arabinofuranosidase